MLTYSLYQFFFQFLVQIALVSTNKIHTDEANRHGNRVSVCIYQMPTYIDEKKGIAGVDFIYMFEP
jgi:hypothetical protein